MNRLQGEFVADAGHEPSMEDILSSIKRIIAEDSDATLASPRTKRAVGIATAERPDPDDEGVLELTDREMPEVEPVALAAAASAVPPNQATGTPPVAPKKTTTAAVKPPLASPNTVEASRTSLAALSKLIVTPDVAGTDTLEGLVREMLRPMLAEWLDARLPEIVERQVAQEIARISTRG